MTAGFVWCESARKTMTTFFHRLLIRLISLLSSDSISLSVGVFPGRIIAVMNFPLSPS